MKRIASPALLFFILWGHISLAQINISQFPAADDTIIFSQHYTPFPQTLFSSIDHTGANETWDFSNWNIGAYDTLIFDEPQGNLFADTFPDAEIVALSSGQYQTIFFGTARYLKTVGNDIISSGSVVPVNQGVFIPMFSNDEFKMFSFPLNTGNSYYDTTNTYAKADGATVGMPYDSVMQKSTVYRHDTIDGFGQIELGSYSYNNLYRNKISDHQVDSMFFYTTGQGWQFLEETITDNINLFWHSSTNFFTGWMEVRNDTVTMIRSLKYNPSVRLELNNFPSEALQYDILPAFEVRAYNINDNSLSINFNDTVEIVFNDGYNSFFGITGNRVPAVAGIATFNTMNFSSPGNYNVIAISDTAEVSPGANIIVHPAPDSIVIINLSSAPEGETLTPFEVHAYNTLGQLDTFFNGSIKIGKLSGSGKLTGTLTKPLVNGIAVFDDIKFNHEDNYNLIAWISELDSAKIDNEYVSITANPNLQWTSVGADTLSEYVDRASFFAWTGGQDGYLSGTSRQWYDEIGQHYTFTKKGLLTEVIFYFAIWQQVNTTITNDTYKVKIYDAGVLIQNNMPYWSGYLTDSLPIALLGEQSFSAADIHTTDFFVRTPTVITFDTPIEIYSDFIVGIEVNNSTADDTIVVWIDGIGDALHEKRAMRHTIDYPSLNIMDGWVRDLDWRPTYDVDNMIMPVLNIDTADIVTGIIHSENNRTTVYPNPTTGSVNITSNQSINKIEITDLSGRLISSYLSESEDKKITIGIENLSQGLYVIEISFSKSAPVKEKLVILEAK